MLCFFLLRKRTVENRELSCGDKIKRPFLSLVVPRLYLTMCYSHMYERYYFTYFHAALFFVLEYRII